MNKETNELIHWSFWLIGVIALIWNVMGVINYFAQMNPEILASYGESARMIVDNRPAWATAGFAAAVFGGALGCILLLLRKPSAQTLFILSLLGVVVTMEYTLSLSISFTVGEIVGMIVMPFVVAIFLLWYARLVANRGWNK